MAAGTGTRVSRTETVGADGVEIRDGGEQNKGSEGKDDIAGREGFGCVEAAAFGEMRPDLEGRRWRGRRWRGRRRRHLFLILLLLPSFVSCRVFEVLGQRIDFRCRLVSLVIFRWVCSGEVGTWRGK